MEKYGFVYIWFDRKHKRFYIGSHWGIEDDGYVCSSNWMRDAHRRRPCDFKRRIIARVFTNRRDLLLEEHRWLSMTKPQELGSRYYNHTTNVTIPSVSGFVSTSTKKKIRDAQVGEKNHMWGKTHTPEARAKISNTHKGRRLPPEQTAKTVASRKANGSYSRDVSHMNTPEHVAARAAKLRGQKRSQEAREKMRQAQLGRKQSFETKAKRSESLKLAWATRKAQQRV